MTRRYRLVIHAYPPAYRREHGEELLATAVELRPDGWSWREATSLLVGGLRERAHRATGRTRSGAWTSGVRTAVVLFLVLLVAEPIAHLLVPRADVSYDVGWPVLLAPLPVIGILLVTSRWPAACAASGLAIVGTARDLGRPELVAGVRLSSIVFSVVLAALVWSAALLGDGRRAMRPTTALGVLVAAVALAGVLHMGTGALLLLAMLGLIASGLVLASVDPRPLVVATTLALLTATLLATGPRGGVRGAIAMLFVLGLVLPTHLGIKRLTRTTT